MKILIMYRLWSKCVPMNLKRIPITFEIKLTHNFGPLSITFSLRRLFSAKMAIFCVFGRIEYQEPKQFQSKWPRWFFLVHWSTFLSQSKQNSKFLFFAFLQVPIWGYVESSDPLYSKDLRGNPKPRVSPDRTGPDRNRSGVGEQF